MTMKKLIDYEPPEPTARKVTQLVCQSCGAPLESDGHCAYCGARYDIEYSSGPRPIFLEVEHPRVRKLEAKTSYDINAMHCLGDELGKLAQRKIAADMADALTQAIKYTTYHDLERDAVVVRGELRIVDPDFRF